MANNTATDNSRLSATSYSIDTDFKALHDVDVGHIISTQLPSSHHFIGIHDKLDDTLKDMLLRPEFWMKTIQSYVNIVKNCITEKKSKLKAMQKKLIHDQLVHRSQFATTNTLLHKPQSPSERRKYIDIFLITFDIVIDAVKADLCKNYSHSMKSVKGIVDHAFGDTDDATILESYTKLEHQVKVKETIYYISGWLLSSCKKASKQRNDDMANVMNDLCKQAVGKESAKQHDMSLMKMDRTEKHNALFYVSPAFFHLVLRFELIFVQTLQLNTLARR